MPKATPKTLLSGDESARLTAVTFPRSQVALGNGRLVFEAALRPRRWSGGAIGGGSGGNPTAGQGLLFPSAT
jgi:hypothetical protein